MVRFDLFFTYQELLGVADVRILGVPDDLQDEGEEDEVQENGCDQRTEEEGVEGYGSRLQETPESYYLVDSSAKL